MKLLRILALPLIFTAFTAGNASAAASDAFETPETYLLEIADETDPAVRRLENLLAEGSHSGVSESVLLSHVRSATRSPGPMGDQYAREGSEAPLRIGTHVAPRMLPSQGDAATRGGEPSLAQTAAVHLVGSGAVGGGVQVSLPSSGSPVYADSITIIDDQPEKAVPLPPALLLFASGLMGLPLVRRMGLRLH